MDSSGHVHNGLLAGGIRSAATLRNPPTKVTSTKGFWAGANRGDTGGLIPIDLPLLPPYHVFPLGFRRQPATHLVGMACARRVACAQIRRPLRSGSWERIRAISKVPIFCLAIRLRFNRRSSRAISFGARRRLARWSDARARVEPFRVRARQPSRQHRPAVRGRMNSLCSFFFSIRKH